MQPPTRSDPTSRYCRFGDVRLRGPSVLRAVAMGGKLRPADRPNSVASVAGRQAANRKVAGLNPATTKVAIQCKNIKCSTECTRILNRLLRIVLQQNLLRFPSPMYYRMREIWDPSLSFGETAENAHRDHRK